MYSMQSVYMLASFLTTFHKSILWLGMEILWAALLMLLLLSYLLCNFIQVVMAAYRVFLKTCARSINSATSLNTFFVCHNTIM